MKSIDLIHHQINLEYQLDLNGMLVPFPGSAEQALYIVYRYSQGYVPYFNYRLSAGVLKYLLRLGPKGAFDQPGEVIKIISDFHHPCIGGNEVFQSGYIARLPELDELPVFTWERDGWVIKVHGRVVSKTISVRAEYGLC